MMKMAPGALVDFFADGEIVAGIVLAEEKGRLRVVTEAGREDRISPARVLAAYEGNPRLATTVKGDAARIESARTLAAAHARAARERREDLDIGLVWELLVDDGGERTLEELTELATGERSPAAAAAMLRALVEEKAHFTRRADLWEPRTRGAVEEVLRQREREKRRAEERRRFLASVRNVLERRGAFVRSGEGEETRLLSDLEILAVQGEGSGQEGRDAAGLVSELGIRADSPEEGAFQVLRALGVFSEDENLFIRRHGLQVEFPPGAEEAARRAVDEALGARGDVHGVGASGMPPALAAEIARGARRDLTELEMFSVDDELTSEIDDALFIEEESSGRSRVGIHIADPGFFIAPESSLDLMAQSRAVTFYLPEQRVLMLPSPISESAASLLPCQPRPALSFLATLDTNGTLLDWEVASSVIRSRARVTYEQASAAVRGEEVPPSLLDPPAPRLRAAADRPDPLATQETPRLTDRMLGRLQALHGLALALEAARIEAGAHVIRAPEVDVRVDPDGRITLKRMEADDPGRILVSEMMILASRIAALFCLERGVPCIYRRQPPAEESFPPVHGGGPYDAVAVRRARRGLRRGESSLLPGRHYALGLDAYAQATSPIRRYQDLVIHRQIKSSLAGESPTYDSEALQRIAALTDEAERVARLAERGSDEFWTLRYLEGKKGQVVEGVVVFRDRRRVDVELSETLYTTSIPPMPEHEPGQHLRFVIESVNPRSASIRLRQVD